MAGHFFDMLVPAAALAEGIMRWGCLLNGCCYGRETSSAFGVFLPDIYGDWAVRYPTQFMYSAVSLTLFVFLWRVRRDKPFPGFLALTYLLIYGSSRVAIGLLRGDYAPSLGLALFLGLDLVLVSAVGGLLAWQVWRHRPHMEPST
jgi:phosphatidylglycerol:prolipoprotein diacylglycerol transferase